jgi:hypothetical protein
MTYPGPVVSVEWLRQNFGSPALRVVDATVHLPDLGRDAQAEYVAEHIPGAVWCFVLPGTKDQETRRHRAWQRLARCPTWLRFAPCPAPPVSALLSRNACWRAPKTRATQYAALSEGSASSLQARNRTRCAPGDACRAPECPDSPV